MAGLTGEHIKIATAWLSVPWSCFVAAFLYYTVLTALVLGGVSPIWSLVVGAYAGPVLVYSLTLTWRLLAATMPRAGLTYARTALARTSLAWQG